MTPSIQSSPRLAYLDMAKGILVLLMVVYHSLNYTNQYYLGFRYLSFLPLSFIVITGFLLSTVYAPGFRAGKRGLVRRILLRGVRLLALFTLLNIVTQFVRSPAYGKSVGVTGFFQTWDQVYIMGGSRIAAFEVLLPIAYLLLLAPCLLALAHRHPSLLPTGAALLLAGCTLLDYSGKAIANLSFLTVGLLGMLIGHLLPHPAVLSRFLWLALLAYAAYFPLGMTKGWVFPVQLLGGLVALALICAVSVRLGEAGWWRRRIVRVGQYSLLSYILQIGILQLLSRFIGRPDPLSVGSSMLFVGTLVLMTVAIELTDWLRSHSSKVEQTYKAVFA